MANKLNLKKIAAEALDMANAPDFVSPMDKFNEPEKLEAAEKAAFSLLMQRYEDLGRLILNAAEDDVKYATVLGGYGFRKGDADYQKAYDTICKAAEAYGSEGDAVEELKEMVLRVDHVLLALRKPMAGKGVDKETEDFFGIFDRSSAAKKGWETRKKNGWDPKVGLKEMESKLPKWKNSGTGQGATPFPKRQSELDRLTEARKEYDRTKSPEAQRALFDASSHVWDSAEKKQKKADR